MADIFAIGAREQRTAQRTAELLKRSTPEERQAAREADNAIDEQDRATGAALRRLVESGDKWNVYQLHGCRFRVEVGERGRFCYGDTLPEAVFKALG